MNKIITACFLFISMNILAQDEIYLHTTSAANISDHISYLDHPNLNNNPNATIFVMHNYGSTGYIHDLPIGIWYSDSESKWSVFNEDVSTMSENIMFNVFIADGASVIETTADGASSYHTIDNALINNNPSSVVFASKYWNPNGVYNLDNYGFWFVG